MRFWPDAYKNEAKSTAGLPVYDTVDWCEIQVAGERDTVKGPVHKMHPDPRIRFANAWAAYLRDKDSEGFTGTPLKVVAWLERGDVETLQYRGIRTLEDLAGVPDSNLSNIPGGLSLRQRARDFIKAAKDAAPIEEMGARLAKANEEIAELKSQIAEILAAKRARGEPAEMPESVEAAPKRRGRPPRVRPAEGQEN